MGPWSFAAGFLTTTSVVCLISIIAAAGVAYLLPQHISRLLRALLEWSVCLSGAGLAALALAWQQLSVTGNTISVTPALCGALFAATYLPFGILLGVRAAEPQCDIFPATRALGYSVWQSVWAAMQKGSANWLATAALYAARLCADIAALAIIFFTWRQSVWAWVILAAGSGLFSIYLPRLAQRTKVPVHPPFYTPLSPAPSHLCWPALKSLPVRTVTQIALAVIALEVSGFSIWRTPVAAAVPSIANEQIFPLQGVIAAVRSACPVLAAAALCMLAWMVWRGLTPPERTHPLILASLSPLFFAYPAVATIGQHWYVWAPLATGGLAIYLVLQNVGTRYIMSLVAQRALFPGEIRSSSAAWAMEHSVIDPYGPAPVVSLAISAAAAWFSAASLLAAVYGINSPLAAGHALVWLVLAGLLQLAALLIGALGHTAINNRGVLDDDAA